MTIEWVKIQHDLLHVGLAYLLCLPIGWNREHFSHTAGIRTFPIMAMASCGLVMLVAFPNTGATSETSRVLQGLIQGLGFVGGGAILKEGWRVSGVATAASIFNTGVIGAAVGMERYSLAVILAALNVFTLYALYPLKLKLTRTRDDLTTEGASQDRPNDPRSEAGSE